jgi:hypothetical protein
MNNCADGPIVRTREEDASKPTNWATQAGQAVHFERFFYTSDFRGNVSAIVSSGGNLIEQYRYSATGVPFGIARGDVNADGVVGTPRGGGGGTVAAFTAASNADYDQAVFLEKNKIYEVRADWNLDGVIDAADTAVVSAGVGTATGRKVMSAAGVGNRIGISRLERETVGVFIDLAWVRSLSYKNRITLSFQRVIEPDDFVGPIDPREEDACQAICRFGNHAFARTACFRGKPISCICSMPNDLPPDAHKLIVLPKFSACIRECEVKHKDNIEFDCSPKIVGGPSFPSPMPPPPELIPGLINPLYTPWKPIGGSRDCGKCCSESTVIGCMSKCDMCADIEDANLKESCEQVKSGLKKLTDQVEAACNKCKGGGQIDGKHCQ